MKNKIFGFLTVFTFVFGLAACNTMHGAGEDVEEAGEAVQDAADGE
ncbi:entericidin A/B family lipoprotein [Alteromonas ponticola]|uniref:Entericidin A/B family lipoprotein n=1 Tax=Alteromonas aquimaris TaxID=2998417 RepID=A0ABT3P4F9_9ALTE|nr:entericidin A/B family lipoprotein [Alteromonas aquimaris]MCW8107654.1 entericidin A/B family lipoprotein [Alteromonas aquimaris]